MKKAMISLAALALIAGCIAVMVPSDRLIADCQTQTCISPHTSSSKCTDCTPDKCNWYTYGGACGEPNVTKASQCKANGGDSMTILDRSGSYLENGECRWSVDNNVTVTDCAYNAACPE